ncbi:MAG: NUDIX hydrolase [Candidatus Uhrbacteria bacterium]|nr:NUDIX hydrolase [Candidatus Uhrbacteria bacterium]
MKRDVAVVVLINDKKEIFLVRTCAYPDAWQPVGGGIDPEDSSPEVAVIREAQEEVGFVLDKLEKLITVPFDFGEGDVHCFSMQVSDSVVLHIDKVEIAESGWFSMQNASELPAYPATKLILKELKSRLS